MIIAVDFDGTLAEDKFPDIGEPNVKLINAIKELYKNGHEIILWTSREGIVLDNAVKWCKKQGLKFHKVNDNLDRIKQQYNMNVRKVYSDVYIDDKALQVKDLEDNIIERIKSSIVNKEGFKE
jgi:hypothetical protein